MDIAPNQLVRLLQVGDSDAAMRSSAIWECVSCQTCSARCPKNVDCAGVMDALREVSLAENKTAETQNAIVAFQKTFLENIRRNGRLAELELIGFYKADLLWNTGRIGVLFKDASLGPKMSKRKKLHLLPEKAKDRGVVERIFARCSARCPEPDKK
jgi:heterodisulfide reductase subunit C